MVLQTTGPVSEAVVPLAALRAIHAPIDKYLYLRDLKTRDVDAFFDLLSANAHETLPFIYTPTVGEACQKYHTLPLKTWGMYLSYDSDRGKVLARMRAWRQQHISVAVVTDGERILGLGDLGTGGMGISEGKIMLYTVAAGVDPARCLPICLDVGTNNEELLKDPLYRGIKRRRVEAAEYDAFVDEFIAALKQWQPRICLQFEDFGNHNAFRLLHKYQPQLCCFNDDIQGTACVCLAALLSAARVSGVPLAQQRVLFSGAGEAGVGIGELVAMAVQSATGETREEARKHCFFMDSKGLVCKARTDLQAHKLAFAHDVPALRDLVSAIQELKPTALIGVSTIAGAFTQEVVLAMCECNTRPAIFPLSNPTSKSECTFRQAFEWSDGAVLFASGSPFDPVTTAAGVTHRPSQANNAYAFPAIGHAAVLARAMSLPDDVFLLAARALSEMVTEGELGTGSLFPSFDNILPVSVKIAVQVAQYLEKSGIGSKPGAASWEDVIKNSLWSVSKNEC